MSASDKVKHEAKGWGGIIVGGILLFMFLPSLLGGALGAMAPSAASLTKPIPGNANNLDEQARRNQPASTPTTAASVTDAEMAARARAKEIGDGLAKARAAQPTAPSAGRPTLTDPIPSGPMGELVPGAESVVRAIGPGLKALNP